MLRPFGKFSINLPLEETLELCTNYATGFRDEV